MTALGLIYAPGSSGRTTVHVRFTPKATIENQNLIRRFVPISDLTHRSKKDRYSITRVS